MMRSGRESSPRAAESEQYETALASVEQCGSARALQRG